MGATLISTTVETEEEIESVPVCQCPERGDPHFYYFMKEITLHDIDVSMP